MEKKPHGESIDRKIRSGNIHRREVVRRLAELAYGKVNDCVKLVQGEAAELDGLDLSMLSEIRCSAKGEVEIKLIDRLKVLEQLRTMVEEEGTGLEELFGSGGDGDGR